MCKAYAVSLVPRLLWNANMYTWGEAGIFSHVSMTVIGKGPEFLEQKDV